MKKRYFTKQFPNFNQLKNGVSVELFNDNEVKEIVAIKTYNFGEMADADRLPEEIGLIHR
jgi:hypothetical protein